MYLLSADSVPPTAYVAAATSFTNAANVSVIISFSEPCGGQGGFQCASVDSCNVSRSSPKFFYLYSFCIFFSLHVDIAVIC